MTKRNLDKNARSRMSGNWNRGWEPKSNPWRRGFPHGNNRKNGQVWRPRKKRYKTAEGEEDGAYGVVKPSVSHKCV